jgi:hypothetical protein
MIPIVSSREHSQSRNWAYILPGNQLWDFLEESTYVVVHQAHTFQEEELRRRSFLKQAQFLLCEYSATYKALQPHNRCGRVPKRDESRLGAHIGGDALA